MESFAGMGDLLSAIFSGDPFMLQSEMRTNPAVWPLGLIVTLLGGALVTAIYRFVPFIERNLEPTTLSLFNHGLGWVQL